MANSPFDRVIIHPLEKPVGDDINQLESELDRALRFSWRSVAGDDALFLGDGLQVRARSPTVMFVAVIPGLGFQLNTSDVPTAINAGNGAVVGLDDREAYKPIPLLSAQSFAVPAGPGSGARMDIIEVRANRQIIDSSSRQILNTGTGVFEAGTRNKTLS